MLAKAYITDIARLQKWFMETKATTFSIYHGYSTKGERLFTLNDAETDSETAWEMLESWMDSHQGSGGVLTVYVPGKSSNTGDRIHFKLSGGSGSGYPQVGNVPGIGFYSREQVDERVSTAVQMKELEHQIAQLRAEQTEEPNSLERIGEILRDNEQLAGIVKMGILAFAPKERIPMLAGFLGGDIPAAGSAAPPDNPEDDTAAFQTQIGRIAQHLNKVTDWKKLADFVENNPAQAKNMLASL